MYARRCICVNLRESREHHHRRCCHLKGKTSTGTRIRELRTTLGMMEMNLTENVRTKDSGRRELPDSDDSNDDDRKTSTSSTQRVAGSKRRIVDIDVPTMKRSIYFLGDQSSQNRNQTAPNSPTRHCVRLKVGQRSLNSIVNDKTLPSLQLSKWKVLSNQFVDFDRSSAPSITLFQMSTTRRPLESESSSELSERSRHPNMTTLCLSQPRRTKLDEYFQILHCILRCNNARRSRPRNSREDQKHQGIHVIRLRTPVSNSGRSGQSEASYNKWNRGLRAKSERNCTSTCLQHLQATRPYLFVRTMCQNKTTVWRTCSSSSFISQLSLGRP